MTPRAAEPEAPRRGRPRSEKARQAILRAAAELLLSQGLDAVSMDAVAEHAGVSKATIYRWWPTKEALALDALYTEWAAYSATELDTGSLGGDLIALLRPWIRLLRTRNYGRGAQRSGVREGVPRPVAQAASGHGPGGVRPGARAR